MKKKKLALKVPNILIRHYWASHPPIVKFVKRNMGEMTLVLYKIKNDSHDILFFSPEISIKKFLSTYSSSRIFQTLAISNIQTEILRRHIL